MIRKHALEAGDGQTCRLVDQVRRLECRVRGLHEMLSAEYNLPILEAARLVADTFEPPTRQLHWGYSDYLAEVRVDLEDAIEQALGSLARDLHAVSLAVALVLELRADLADLWSRKGSE